MTKSSVVAAILFSLAIGLGPACAQDPAPAADQRKPTIIRTRRPSPRPARDQANAKNLHGKERKKFRAECKHKGGKME